MVLVRSLQLGSESKSSTADLDFRGSIQLHNIKQYILATLIQRNWALCWVSAGPTLRSVLISCVCWASSERRTLTHCWSTVYDAGSMSHVYWARPTTVDPSCFIVWKYYRLWPGIETAVDHPTNARRWTSVALLPFYERLSMHDLIYKWSFKKENFSLIWHKLIWSVLSRKFNHRSTIGEFILP